MGKCIVCESQGLSDGISGRAAGSGTRLSDRLRLRGRHGLGGWFAGWGWGGGALFARLLQVVDGSFHYAPEAMTLFDYRRELGPCLLLFALDLTFSG